MIKITKNAKNMLKNINKTVKIFCVYGHRCKTTKKWYIGITSFIDDPYKRFGRNGSNYLLKNQNTYKHPKFANAILKYGWENFTHWILGYYTESEIDSAENYWIEHKNSLLKGYNSTNGGYSCHELTNDNKSKISNKVDQIDRETLKVIRTFNSAKDAADFVGLYNNSLIIECCKGKAISAKGFFWKYHTKSIRNDSNKLNKKVMTKGYHIKTPVLKISLDTGDILEKYESTKEAGEKNNINHSNISRCCRHERNTAGGFKWEYCFDGGDLNV